jgi:hypothetical protein
LRLEWDSNPRMTVLQTAVLDHFTTEPDISIVKFNLKHINCKLPTNDEIKNYFKPQLGSTDILE